MYKLELVGWWLETISVPIPTIFTILFGSNQSGYEKAKDLGFLPFILWIFLTIYNLFALMKITICFKQLEVSHIM